MLSKRQADSDISWSISYESWPKEREGEREIEREREASEMGNAFDKR